MAAEQHPADERTATSRGVPLSTSSVRPDEINHAGDRAFSVGDLDGGAGSIRSTDPGVTLHDVSDACSLR